MLVSGKGTGLQAIIDHIRLGVLINTKIVKVISNNATAEALNKATVAGIKSLFVEGVAGKKFASGHEKEQGREKFDDYVASMFVKEDVELVVCAGFNQVLSDVFINKFPNKIMNIHPAYNIEKFGGPGMIGLRVHETVIKVGESISGCAVHYIDSTVDRGPVILRASVPVFKNDTAERLQDRVSVMEHRTYSKAIQLHVDKRVRIHGRDVILDLSDNWGYNWNERQKKYIVYQKEVWAGMGKDIDLIFKPFN